MMSVSFRGTKSKFSVNLLGWLTVCFVFCGTGLASNNSPIVWENVTNMTVAGNSLTATQNGWGNSGANADHAFIGDGAVEFKVLVAYKRFMLGLTEDPASNHYNTINFAIYFNGKTVHVYEKGRNEGPKDSFEPGDIFRVERSGDSISYLKNGEVFYTSLRKSLPRVPLVADVSANNAGASFDGGEYHGIDVDRLVKLSEVELTSPTTFKVTWPEFTSPIGEAVYKIYLNEKLAHQTTSTIWDAIPVGDDDRNFVLIAESVGGDYLGRSLFHLPAEPNYDNDAFDDRYELETYGTTDIVRTKRPFLVNGIVEGVVNSWQKVFYPEANTSYDSTVVVCSPVYGQNQGPVMSMIRNVTNESFEVCVVSADDDENVEPTTITYFAHPDGTWRYPWDWHVHSLAAVKPADQVSTLNDMVPTNFGAWYPNPVVYGTVEVSPEAPAKFQSFYSHGVHPDLPAKAWNEFYGSHAGSDTSGRLPADVHLIMFVEGTYLVGGQYLEIKTTPPIVRGIEEGGTFLNLGKEVIDNAIISSSGLRGNELTFPVLMNQQLGVPNDGLFHVAIDKDTFTTPTRSTVEERVGLAIFSKTPSMPKFSSTRGDVMVLKSNGGKVKLAGLEGTRVLFEINGDEPTLDSEQFGTLTVTEHTTIKAFTQQIWNDKPISPTRTLEVLVAENVTHGIDDGFSYRVYHSAGNESQTLPISSTNTLVPMLQEVHQWSLEMRPKVTNAITEVEAYIAIIEPDYYGFSLETTGEMVSELYVEDMTTPVLASANTSYYEKGVYPILIKTISSSTNSSFALRWSNSTRNEIIPGGRLFYNTSKSATIAELVDFDGDNLTDKEENSAGSNPRLVDSDGDGISDFDEIRIYFTDPTSVDSDGDEVSDYREIFETGTNPKAFDSDGDGLNDYIETLSNGTYTEAFRVSGAEYVRSLGDWKREGESAISENYNGTLEFDVDVPFDDMFFLNIVGGSADQLDLGKLFNLSVFIDDEHVNTLNIADDLTSQSNHYGMKFESSLDVEEGGPFSFKLRSTGGSQLFIDGLLVVDNDGLHGEEEKVGVTQLTEGVHSIMVIYFEQENEDLLEVSFAKGTDDFSVLSQEELSSLVEWWYYEGTWESLPSFNELLEVRGGFSGSFNLSARKSQKRKTWYLPWLAAGAHKVKIRWNNGLHERFLRIDELIFNSLSDDDLNENGLQDWIDVKLAKECTVADVKNSLTSPFCLEGQGQYPGMMTISNGSSPIRGVDDGWYSNIELNPEKKTKVKVTFQNEVKAEKRKITWKVTRVPKVDSLTIRVGDSLLLAPGTKNSIGTGKIFLDGQAYRIKHGKSRPFKFDTPGTYQLTSEYKVKPKKLTYPSKKRSRRAHHRKRTITKMASLEVKVVGVSLVDQPFPSFVGKRATRNLIGSLPEGVVYQADSRIAQWEERNSIFVSYIVDSIVERKVLVRLEEGGAILGDVKLQGIAAAGMGQTTYYISEIFEDGTYISDLVLVAEPMTEGAEINLSIFVPGATFLDGSTYFTVTKDDFNELGHYLVRIAKDPSISKTANCHRMTLDHNGLFIHRR
jgi:hypothetical protein